MPRTSAVECPGCPPLRALTFDVLGLVKVIEARSKEGGVPKVVERWGEPDSSKCVLAVSIDDCKSDPLLAVARKSGMIEVLNPLNGDLRISISNTGNAGPSPEDDAIVGLHLFRKRLSDLSPRTWDTQLNALFSLHHVFRRLHVYTERWKLVKSTIFNAIVLNIRDDAKCIVGPMFRVGFSSARSCTLLTCTTKGNVSMRSVEIPKTPVDSIGAGTPRTWSVCGSGNILCSKVDGNENYALFGGKGVEVNVWDLDNCNRIWTAKSPVKNSLGIFTPTCFTSATFLNKEDHRKFVAGTNSHQVRLYDISAQRRPVVSFDFRESPIKAVSEDLDGHTIYIGNGSGDLASVDIRTGKLLGCFLGKCSGSIRSIVRHPELPVIASCGLDSYLRFWDIKTRQPLSAVFLKQHLTNVVFDSNFADEEPIGSAADRQPSQAQDMNDVPDGDEEVVHVKRKKTSKENGQRKKLKSKKKGKRLEGENY